MSDESRLVTPRPIVKPGHKSQCTNCRKRMTRAEAHWACKDCRRECPEDCVACQANGKDELRIKLLRQVQLWYQAKNLKKGEPASTDEVPWTCPPRPIRKSDQLPQCRSCRRRLSRAEAHWLCRRCRKDCQENCNACQANSQEEWRVRMFKHNESRLSSYKSRQSNKKKNVTKEIKKQNQLDTCTICRKFLSRAEAHRICARCRKDCPKNCKACQANSQDQWRVALFRQNKQKALKLSKARQLKKITSNPIKNKSVNSPKDDFNARVKSFEDLLFGDLSFSLPPEMMENDVLLPEVPKRLKEKFLISRNTLTRLLATSSICFHVSSKERGGAQPNPLLNLNTNGLGSFFSSLIRHKANELGTVIIEIRKFLLSRTTCTNPHIPSQLANGEIRPNESMFSNVPSLKKLILAKPEYKLAPRVFKQSQANVSNPKKENRH